MIDNSASTWSAVSPRRSADARDRSTKSAAIRSNVPRSSRRSQFET